MDLAARIKTGFLIIAAVFLVAFTLWWLMPGNDSEARWEDYLSRLARLSQQAVPERAPLPIVPYPGNRELHQPIPEHRVDMLDYLELRHCNLMSLISERNSVLGKLQADSLRFKHEVTFIHRARQCLASDKLDNQALITLLEQVVTEKQAALPALYWNALVASAEFRQFFSQSPSAMAGDSQAALLSLEQLAQSPFQGQTLPSPEQLFGLESYPTVHHLVSTIRGELAPGRGPLDLLRDSFPGGSITGAPKRRAMQIIAELEPCSREAYCGSLLYISADRHMDSNIAIRSLVANHGSLRCWGGGGIVADSEAEQEYQETYDKVGRFLSALEQRFR